jgi:hypothetical protein
MASARLVTLVLTFSFALCTSVFAAPAKKKSNKENFNPPVQEVSLREQALNENKNSGLNQKKASEVQMESGVLTLKDPRPEVQTRSWNYFVGFTAQQFQPEGKGTNDFSSFDLGENGSTLMPGIEFGALSKDFGSEDVLWNAGVRLKGSFSSQAATAVLPSGYVIDDARLNTTLLSVGPTVSVRWVRYNWLSFVFTPEFGTMNYTQTSSTDYGKFSKQSGYKSLAYALDFRVSEKWSVFTEYAQRELNDNQLALQKDNFELGTKVTW